MPVLLTPKHLIIFSIVFLGFLAVIVLNSDSESERLATEADNQSEDFYKFRDPQLANLILQKLDIFEQVEVTQQQLENQFNKVYMGLKPDNEYCQKHRAFIVNNPDTVFKHKNIITSLIHDSLFRAKVIPAIGVDIQPEVGGGYTPLKRAKDNTYDLSLNVTSFFTFFGLYPQRALGVQYSCLSQISNSIPGHENLFRKDLVSESVVSYAQQYASRPHCFNYNKFFPKTWILYHEDACLDFFRHFNSEEYKQLKKERGNIVYMRKIGARVHQGRGVFPINDEEEVVIKDMYKNGALCGKLQDNNIIQYYIHNPLLLNGHKFDFRIYMLIASSNPVIAYYYDGFLRMSLHEYKSDSKELGALLTNTALSKSAFTAAAQNGTYQGMTSEELKNYHLWNFQRLEDYLIQANLITDRNWLNNYLRPEFRKALAHLLRMTQQNFLKKSSIYHLFGMDFMLDANLNLWFIEANASPSLEGFSKEMKGLVSRILVDHYEIVYGLLRSRMKRVISFVNVLSKDLKSNSVSVYIPNLSKRRAEFQQITTNYFEPEFRPSSKNGFQPIIDENNEGEARYFGLIQQECLNDGFKKVDLNPIIEL